MLAQLVWLILSSAPACTFFCYMVARATFLAPVRTYMLGSCSKFACSPKIVCSLFSIFITFLSDRSFYAKRSARARFWLLCARARSDHAQNLYAVLKLAAFYFLFTWLLSQIAPSTPLLPAANEEACLQVISQSETRRPFGGVGEVPGFFFYCIVILLVS